jgi:hypothetical protein
VVEKRVGGEQTKLKGGKEGRGGSQGGRLEGRGKGIRTRSIRR